MESSIIKLAQECPGAIISIKVTDLVAANQLLIAEVRKETEEIINKKNAVVFFSREDVMKKLNIASSTLWRWQRSGYLVPINVGGQRRYKSTDIDEILEGKR